MIIDVTKYGEKDDIAPAFISAVSDAEPGDTIFFPKNEYHFYKEHSKSRYYHMTNTDSFDFPKKHFAMLIEKKQGITVDGNGSVFVMHGNMCILGAVKCSDINLCNFTVVFANPTNVELTVTEKKGNLITYRVPDGCKFNMKGNNVIFYERARFNEDYYWTMVNNEKSHCAVIHRENKVFRESNQPFTGPHISHKSDNSTIKVLSLLPKKYCIGDIVTLSKNRCREGCGLFFWESKNIHSSNITVHYMHGFGWLTQMCENVYFDSVVFKPAENRRASAFADCIHICGCKGEVKINNCYFSDAHDDGINIHGAFLRVSDVVDSNTVTLKFIHSQQGGYTAFYPGDTVRFYYRNNLQQCGEDLTVTAVEEDIEKKKCTVTFDKTLPEDIDSKYLGQNNIVAENATYCPQVEISNCTFTAIPTRGILCTTSGYVDIHHNKFDNVQMANIYISNDANEWYESGPVRKMDIHDNVFDIPEKIQKEWKVTGAVYINPITLGGSVTEPVHKHIHIYNNKIKTADGYALYSIGAEDVTIDDSVNPVEIN